MVVIAHGHLVTQCRLSKMHKKYFSLCNKLHDKSTWSESETCLCDDDQSYAHNSLKEKDIPFAWQKKNVMPEDDTCFINMRMQTNLRIKGWELEIINLPTSDQGWLITWSEVGSEICMRVKILEGGYTRYNNVILINGS